MQCGGGRFESCTVHKCTPDFLKSGVCILGDRTGLERRRQCGESDFYKQKPAETSFSSAGVYLSSKNLEKASAHWSKGCDGDYTSDENFHPTLFQILVDKSCKTIRCSNRKTETDNESGNIGEHRNLLIKNWFSETALLLSQGLVIVTLLHNITCLSIVFPLLYLTLFSAKQKRPHGCGASLTLRCIWYYFAIYIHCTICAALKAGLTPMKDVRGVCRE